MPIPQPSKKEIKAKDKSGFISRCMGDGAMQEYDPKVRAGICYTSWNRAKKRKEGGSLAEVDLNDGRWVEICAVGTYKNGTVTVTDQILKEMAEDYDPKLHESQVVLDHNEFGPAYGWVKAVKKVGDKLLAQFKQVPKYFNQWVQEGRYKKRSIAIYDKMAETGRAYLRHVAFLGGAAPAVKGLQPAFSDDPWHLHDQKGAFTALDDLDNDDIEGTILHDAKQGGDNYFQGKDGDMTPEEVRAMIEEATKKAKAEAKAEIQAELKDRDDKILALQDENKRTMAKLSEQSKSAVAERAITLRDRLVEEMKLAPAAASKFVPLFTSLADVGTTIKLSEKVDDKETERELTPLQLLSEFVEALPPVVKKGKMIGHQDGGLDDDDDYSEFEDASESSILFDKKYNELKQKFPDKTDQEITSMTEKALKDQGVSLDLKDEA